MRQEDGLGMAGDLGFVLDTVGIPDGAVVAAGDNIFRFDLLPLWNGFGRGGSATSWRCGRLAMMTAKPREGGEPSEWPMWPNNNHRGRRMSELLPDPPPDSTS